MVEEDDPRDHRVLRRGEPGRAFLPGLGDDGRGNVRFHVYNGRVQADGFADEVERGITTVDELVDYAWSERKRILD